MQAESRAACILSSPQLLTPCAPDEILRDILCTMDVFLRVTNALQEEVVNHTPSILPSYVLAPKCKRSVLRGPKATWPETHALRLRLGSEQNNEAKRCGIKLRTVAAWAVG